MKRLVSVVGFAGGSDFVAVAGNFVSGGRHCVPGLVRLEVLKW